MFHLKITFNFHSKLNSQHFYWLQSFLKIKYALYNQNGDGTLVFTQDWPFDMKSSPMKLKISSQTFCEKSYGSLLKTRTKKKVTKCEMLCNTTCLGFVDRCNVEGQGVIFIVETILKCIYFTCFISPILKLWLRLLTQIFFFWAQ